jgi:uncharacterized integral membrane protein
MSVLHPRRDVPAATTPKQGPPGLAEASLAEASSADRVPRTRTSTAWFGICSAAVALVVLIVFMLQKARNVEVTFLWTHRSVSLALTLLIAGVAAAVLATAVGEARVGQLRRLARRHR